MKPVPETVILECQRLIYDLMDEAVKKCLTAREKEGDLKKAISDAQYAELKVSEMIDFLSENEEEEYDKKEIKEDLLAHFKHRKESNGLS